MTHIGGENANEATTAALLAWRNHLSHPLGLFEVQVG